MTIVSVFYQCSCGALLKIEKRTIWDAAFAMTDLVIDHEDISCG